MPVVSPSRYTPATSALSGSYRSTLTSSSSIDKPYYRNSSGTYVTSTVRSSHGDRTTEYRTRYSDVDGKRERKTSLVEYTRSSRAPSAGDSDSGISSRYRSDRSESRSRDVSTTRSESSRTSDLNRGKRNVLSTAALAMSTVDFYNKYSPANYVPLTQRIQQAQAQNNSYGEISRSKSISNDIGRPPASDCRARRARNSAATITEKPEGRYKDCSPSPSYSKRHSLANGVRDTNGNDVPSVSEVRKRFDPKMAVTKLPANDSRYPAKTLEQYLSQLKDCENGTVGYTKIHAKDDQPVPVHLPHLEKNGVAHRWDGSPNSSSSSNSDLTISKTTSEPVSLARPSVDRNSAMSTSLTAKHPSERLASIKNQLDPNNPIGKILEKSTVIQVENGDLDYAERKKIRNSPEIKIKDLKSDIEKQSKTPKHTTNFASYIQISQPIASGAAPKKSSEAISDKPAKNKDAKKSLKYIDSEEDRSVLDNDVESPSGTGFENKTFEHENFLKKRTEGSETDAKDDGVKSMETSTESTISESTEDSSPETPSSRTKILDLKDYDYIKSELAGGKSGPSGLRRSSERTEIGERTEKHSHTSGLNGLRNIGNTCFMNSVIQCLSNTRPLLEYLADDKYTADINTTLSCMKGALIKAFASVVKELWRGGERDSVVNTTSLKAQVQRFAPRFMGYSQQDAQEFLRYLLEGLHEDVNRVTIKPKPILTEIDDSLSDSAKAAEAWSRYVRMEDSRVGDTFIGQLKSTLRCTHCHHDSVTFDPFWDLSLPIPSRTGNLKLQQCLQHFVREEELDGDEKPTCSKCGVRRKCLKWFTVQKFPQVLVLHLKRFSPTERFRGKLSVVVEFPLNGLDMSPFAAAPTHATYNLYAVSNHSGTTYSGHYTAYCKHPYTGDWHEYNDSRVSTIAPRDVVSAEAYVLFYELVPRA
ncbi:ubiquitin carboxyl-terminal hydrolase 15-like [Maniola jurtina]|uniref:ubiquitin carboxyl-terminal hydrolase 15-like n=1 Tax=Maniola jurtina TaxID=191418 RepID=UPI001E6863F4|nr:ubiquitin carboxyl-terminal hydrolase 15-like [Maniola jurtina]XP_045769933.1 ubiquitin carboxyl-terminal hydrolase 15-like [Maniola jurtina]XP_045769934.1 ubiquitin carboxyl-terminal hydrolase 15-like [Maniola jurtina]XP_045769935.1 ubiquitin carboxyl-terminal hydrolase 15-like [Maniola jurtina]